MHAVKMKSKNVHKKILVFLWEVCLCFSYKICIIKFTE